MHIQLHLSPTFSRVHLQFSGRLPPEPAADRDALREPIDRAGVPAGVAEGVSPYANSGVPKSCTKYKDSQKS